MITGQNPRARVALDPVGDIVASCWLNFLQLSNKLGIAITDQAVDVLAPSPVAT